MPSLKRLVFRGYSRSTPELHFLLFLRITDYAKSID
jgi:hypothetical protein